MADPKLKPGDTVQSQFRSRWFGTVVEVIDRGSKLGGQRHEPLVRVRPVCTADGRQYRKEPVHWLSAAWLVKATIPATLRPDRFKSKK